MSGITPLAPDRGWQGNPARGAAMGRVDSGPHVDLETARYRAAIYQRWIDAARGAGSLSWKANRDVAESEIERFEREIAAKTPRQFYLRQIPLDSGGYDSGGSYWGHGERLYRFESVDGAAEGYLRADRRPGAMVEIRKSYPAAVFFGEAA